MFFRLTFCKFSPESVNDALSIYNKDVIPVVSRQPGNIAIHMLEPVDKADDFISLTQWRTKADADAYESSGLYASLVAKISDLLAKPPVLKSYDTKDVVAMAH